VSEYLDDAADALVNVMTHYSDEMHLNIGTGHDLSILDLAELIADVVSFEGQTETNLTKPDGTPRKVLNTSRLTALGWQPKIDLREGLTSTYHWLASRYGLEGGVRASSLSA
jgi:GDP-L-fucose synthase